jgi:hypothetical protein
MTQEKVQASMTSVEHGVSGLDRIGWAPRCHVSVILEQKREQASFRRMVCANKYLICALRPW